MNKVLYRLEVPVTRKEYSELYEETTENLLTWMHQLLNQHELYAPVNIGDDVNQEVVLMPPSDLVSLSLNKAIYQMSSCGVKLISGIIVKNYQFMVLFYA